MSNDFIEIKNKVNIVDYIETLTGIPAAKVGSYWELKECPFCGHKDCFRIDINSKTYKCWSGACTSKPGDIFTFVQEYLNLQNKYDQLKKVAKDIGYTIPEKANSNFYKNIGTNIKDADLLNYIYNKSMNTSMKNKKKVISYLKNERLISEELIKKLIQNNKVGYNYFNEREYMIFPIHNMKEQLIMLNNRSIDKKQRSIINKGKLEGNFWYLNKNDVLRANEIYITEGIINALTIMSLGLDDSNFNKKNIKKRIAISTISSNNINIDFSFLRKNCKVYLVKDNDKAGTKFVNNLYYKLLEQNISVYIIPLKKDKEINDINDVAIEEGYLEVGSCIDEIEKRPIFNQKILRRLTGKEFGDNERFIVNERSIDYDEGTKEEPKIKQVCNFKVWQIETYRILDFTTDEEVDAVYRVLYSTSEADFKTTTFISHEIKDEKKWKSVGLVYAPQIFKRYLNLLLHRSDKVTEIKNIVGLNYIKNKPIIIDANNTAFHKNDMSPYQFLKFPRSNLNSARQIYEIYKNILTEKKGLIIINWMLGSFLKAQLGFYPHLSVDAESSSGKSTILNWLSKNFKTVRYSGEQLKTSYRRTIMFANTLYPVFFDEASRVSKKMLVEITNILNQAYNANPTRRGIDAHLYYICAPACLMGQDEIISQDNALNAKAIKLNIDDSKGVLPDLEKEKLEFPLRLWMEYLVNNPVEEGEIKKQVDFIRSKTNLNNEPTTERTIINYAIQLIAWNRLESFLGLKYSNSFVNVLLTHLEQHIYDKSESSAIDESIQILKDFSILYDMDTSKNDLIAYKQEDKDIFIAFNINVMFNYMDKYQKEYAINTPNTFIKRVQKHPGLMYKTVVQTKNGKKEYTSYPIRINGKQSRRTMFSHNELKKFGVFFTLPENLSEEWISLNNIPN